MPDALVATVTQTLWEGRSNTMQVNHDSRRLQIIMEIFLLIINAGMLLVWYIARANQMSSGFTENAFQSITQASFLVGLLTLALLATVVRKMRCGRYRFPFMALVTLWNQACITGFVVSLIPFRLSG